MKQRPARACLVAVSLAALILVLASCPLVVRRAVYAPEYLGYDALRKGVAITESRPLSQTGKIYIKGDYIFVNEYHEGVHVINNTDPAAPVVEAFITIPGNVDIAIRGNILYADSYVDLVALDIEDPANVLELKRIKNAFEYPYFLPWLEDEYDSDARYETIDEENGIVVGWEVSKTETVLLDQFDYGYRYMLMEAGVADGASGGDTGTGGSMARFTIIGDYLYVVHSGYLQLVTIADPADPNLWSKIAVGWDIETIFPYKDKLFIGSQSGMYVYDNVDPENPTQICKFEHATSCDPVVATDTYAYVTLRSGTMCGGGSNQLDVLDITDIENPVLIKSYAMQGPYGLSVDGDILFVCDGVAGLKIYNVAVPQDISLIDAFQTFPTYDVILNPPLAIVVGPQGLYQYDYGNLADIQLVSTLAVGSD